MSFFSHQGLILSLGDNIVMHMTETGRRPPIFSEASFIASEILDSGYEFDAGEMFYNKFRYVLLWLSFHSISDSTNQSI